MNVEQIAIVCHEANRAYCATLGDTSHVAWADTDVGIRQSAMAGVELLMSNPAASTQEVHESWLADKQANGWTYGEAKDVANRKHPCCVPWDDLPLSMRVKDTLFRSIVLTFIPE